MKNGIRQFTFYLFLSVMLFSCGPKPTIMQPVSSLNLLQKELDQLFLDPAFDTATWGVVVQSLENGGYLYRLNEKKGFMPASNMKIYTTSAALVKLGPDFRYKTTLFTKGKIEDGVLNGDLVIRGSGDPTLTGRYFDGNSLAVFETWIDSLKEAGIEKINGRIIGDDNYFEDEIMGQGWAWDYQSDWYAAQISALSFNDNCLDIQFTPSNTIGELVSFKLKPSTQFVTIKNNVKTVRKGLGKGVYFNRKRASNYVEVSGSIELGAKPKWDWFSVENPTLFSSFIFRELLEQNGISISNQAFDIDSLANYSYEIDSVQMLAGHQSIPLSEIVKTTNKVSQNLYAELLLRTLGKEFKDIGDGEHGVEVVKEVMSRFGIDPNKFGMRDGSGLSRYDMVTPNQTSLLLRGMKNHRTSEYFYNSLPIAGVDGTIRSRMKGTKAENNVRAKTGTIDRVKSLSGYVTTADGELLSFVMMINNYMVPTSKANYVQDLVCERLANFRRN